jgi:hypothetical protein
VSVIEYLPTPNGDGTLSLRATRPDWRERLRRMLRRLGL